MKKGIVLVLALALVFSLVGCGYSQDDLDAAYKQGYDKGYSEGAGEAEEEWWDGYDRGYADGVLVNRNSSSSSSNINEYSGDIEAILDYIYDNPHEFYLYGERDLELAYEQGYEDGLYDR